MLIYVLIITLNGLSMPIKSRLSCWIKKMTIINYTQETHYISNEEKQTDKTQPRWDRYSEKSYNH